MCRRTSGFSTAELNLGRRRLCRWGVLMLTNFCPKCWKALCVCLVGASIVGSLGSLLKADPQAKLLPAHAVGSVLTAGTTGTAGPAVQMYVVHDQITGQRYVGVWP